MANSIGYLELEIVKGDTFLLEFWLEDEDGNVENATNKTALLEMYEYPDGPVIASFTSATNGGALGTHGFVEAVSVTEALDFTTRLYDVQVIDGNYSPARKETVFQGPLRLIRKGA